MIGSIILSAGESKRMGEPKALLKIKNSIFINHIIEVLFNSDIKEIVTILGHHYEEILMKIDKDRSKIAINHDYKDGQLSSLISGIEYFRNKDVAGVIVCLVDHPFINVEIVPTIKGKRGHPVLFARSVFEELKKASPEVGAREVIWNNRNEVCELEIKNRNILIGINTPEDYKNNIEKFL